MEPFVDGYYKVGETTKARELFGKLKYMYQDRLEYYAGIPLEEQYEKIDEIIADMEGYRRNIDILIGNNDREMAEKETLIFNEYIDKFKHFYKDNILQEDDLEPGQNPDMADTVPVSDTTAIDAATTGDKVPDTTLVPATN